ncbi:damage-control phosphatase ARMT1-like isoform X2 [Chelonus insularis]|nr:damage-control phosphatase ARMT1-like isoform X2 [Chelonus insularis]
MSSSALDIMGLQDASPPFGSHLSGLYKRSFAYVTLKDRVPVTVTRIIDRMSRSKDEIIEKYGQDSAEELKQVIGDLSELKSELMTNKFLSRLNSTNTENSNDIIKWNREIENQIDKGKPPTWYNATWLFSECYMYRRIAQIFQVTKTLTSYDPFESLKYESFHQSLAPMSSLAKFINTLLNKTETYSLDEQKTDFINLLKMNLWGNQCDLSLSAGASIPVEDQNPFDQIAELEENLLINDSESVWNLLNQAKETRKNITVDVILDNAGYELFTDLCLGIFLTSQNIVHKIRFYVKMFPWFVSDTMEKDFYWMIDQLKNSSNNNLKAMGEKCLEYLKSERWSIEVESFWTEPFDFSKMKTETPKLYNKLSEAVLIITKGDLNYRKLLGDINWEYSTKLKTALREFQPTNLIALRTVKADLIVGISSDKAAELSHKDPNWMTTGQYGIISAALNDS